MCSITSYYAFYGLLKRTQVLFLSDNFLLSTCFILTACLEIALGMESGAIANEQITASSDNGVSGGMCCYPHFARLNHNTQYSPDPDTTDNWIQIDLRSIYRVTGLVTQGGNGGWISQIKVMIEHPAGSGQLEYIKHPTGEHVVRIL